MKLCNVHRISPNQIPKFTESDSWNEVATRTNNLNVMSCLFHVSPLAPPSPQRPSCHIAPVSGGRTFVILRLDRGAGGQQRLDHLQVAFPSRNRQRPVASVRRARLQMATGRAKSHELLRRISQDFGSEKLGVWSTISN